MRKDLSWYVDSLYDGTQSICAILLFGGGWLLMLLFLIKTIADYLVERKSSATYKWWYRIFIILNMHTNKLNVSIGIISVHSFDQPWCERFKPFCIYDWRYKTYFMQYARYADESNVAYKFQFSMWINWTDQ